MRKKSIDYSEFFTKRSDGRWQKWIPEQKKYIYDKDPERLYQKWQEAIHPELAPVTVKQAADEWENEYRETISIRTWKNYAPHYAEIVSDEGDRPIEDITGTDVINYLNKKKAQGYSRTVVNECKVIWNGILNYALAQGYIKVNPALGVKLPKGLPHGKRSAPTDDDIKLICKNIDLPFGLFPYLLVCTGLRKAEALALQWGDIDFKKNEIHVNKSLESSLGKPYLKSTKSETSNRDVPMIAALKDVLLKEAAKHSTDDVVFPAPKSNRGGPGGGYMTDRQYDGAWDRYCQLSGLSGITAHNLRHGTATLLFESGCDVYTAQKILGHAQVSTTMSIYTELRAAQEKKSVTKFEKHMKSLLK